MNPWYAKAVVLAASVALVAIRAPHGNRSRTVPVVKSRKGTLEIVLLTIMWAAFFLPLLWALSPLLSFADYPLHPAALAGGVALLVLGLWLFHRSHVDLGTMWSITLEVREGHRLVTSGLYGLVRHPMYLALLVYGLGIAIGTPNWFAGPAYLLATILLVALRLGPEEQLMREEFPAEYDAYAKTTKRLIPGVW